MGDFEYIMKRGYKPTKLNLGISIIFGLSCVVVGTIGFLQTGFKLFLGISNFLTGFIFLFPKKSGTLKDPGYLKINKEMITWDLSEKPEPQSLAIASISKILEFAGIHQIETTDGNTYTIASHRIMNKEKFLEFKSKISELKRTIN